MAENATTHQSDHVGMLQERYKCPYFRILVIGGANAGKTTIFEKVSGVDKGTKPIVYDQNGVKLKFSLLTHIKYLLRKKMAPGSSVDLTPRVQGGVHSIEHQITYQGSNFIFHDSQGFESGGTGEMEVVWDFIKKRSAKTEVKDQLHAIWYCIPMEGACSLLPAELDFFKKGTEGVPLIAIFTKFDALINQEYIKLSNIEEKNYRWEEARANALGTFNEVYLPKVLKVNYPPNAHVLWEVEKDCAKLTEQTASVISNAILHDLFVSTQRNNFDLCVKAALEHALDLSEAKTTLQDVIFSVLTKFPRFWAHLYDVRPFYVEDAFD